MGTENKGISLKSYKTGVVILSVVCLLSTIVINEDVVSFANDYMEESRFLRLLKMRKRSRNKPKRIGLIWLMGFPGSGTDDVITNVEQATQLSMGTNYGNIMETRKRQSYVNTYTSVLVQKDWYKSGPYKNNVDYDIGSSEILVKTFCTGYCLPQHKQWGDCTRTGYIRSLVKLGHFWTACAKSRSYKPNRKKQSKGMKAYWKNRVKKVVVVLRDPLNMVKARFIQLTRETGMKPSMVNFLAYCEDIDKRWGNVKEIKAKKKLGWLNLEHHGIPCYPEFFRIVVWYRNTYQIASKRESIVVRYEDLYDKPDKNIGKILEFAGLTRVWTKALFGMRTPVAGAWFSDEETEKIGKFMHILLIGATQ